jgi:hypothetical protein
MATQPVVAASASICLASANMKPGSSSHAYAASARVRRKATRLRHAAAGSA